MEFEAILNILDTAAANLAKLDAVLARAEPHFPTGPALGTAGEYDNLVRD